MSRSGDPTKPVGDDRDRTIARLERALSEALTRIEGAEAVLDDQRKRLKSLGEGREKTMQMLNETRDELKRVSIERDELRKQLARVDGVQTTTIALPEDDIIPALSATNLPSLEDLMAALGHTEDTRESAAGHLHQKVQPDHDTDGSEEMLSPLLVFPDDLAATAEPIELGDGSVSRLLVLLDAERPVTYPLNKEVMTIGRADVADIQIEHHFLSRLHARIVSSPSGVAIEDIDSKNGIRVNARNVTRQELKHGDVVDVGRLRFRYIELAPAGAD